MKRATWICSAVLLGAAPAWAASIGLFSTPDCTSCNLTVPPGGSSVFYVRALTDGIPYAQWGGGADFRIEGVPPGWLATAVRNPQINVVIGDPLGSGATVGFPFIPEGTCYLLYTIALTAPAGVPVTDVVLRVTGSQPPYDPRFPCPWFMLYCGDTCDIFDPYCVGGGALFVNSSQQCLVSTVPSTWSDVKKLYFR